MSFLSISKIGPNQKEMCILIFNKITLHFPVRCAQARKDFSFLPASLNTLQHDRIGSLNDSTDSDRSDGSFSFQSILSQLCSSALFLPTSPHATQITWHSLQSQWIQSMLSFLTKSNCWACFFSLCSFKMLINIIFVASYFQLLFSEQKQINMNPLNNIRRK